MQSPVPRSCPVCDHAKATLLAEGEDFEYGTLPGPFRMWRCEACGHGYLDPLPEPEQLPRLYPETYYTTNPRSPIHFAGALWEVKVRREVERILDLGGPGPLRRVMDVGCGDGERLVRLREKLGPDADLTGVDLRFSPEHRERLARHGVRAIVADVEAGLDFLGEPGPDLVVLCQLLEHLRAPGGLLQNLAKRLPPGGRVLLETPNQGGIDFRLFRKRYWGGYHFPRHFHVFGVESLLRAVREAGLRVERHGFLPSGFGIASVRNRLGLNSVERGPRLAEVLHMRNPMAVGLEVGLDLAAIALGRATSNQYVLASRS